MSDIRRPAVAGTFYPSKPAELQRMVQGMLNRVDAEPAAVTAGIAPHAGLIYSGESAANVFKRIDFPPLVVILAPNHTGRGDNMGGAGAWSRGAYGTPIGDHPIAADFMARLENQCSLVAHDPAAHMYEHSIEVELPFLSLLSPSVPVAPIVLAWSDWGPCRQLADALVRVISETEHRVLLIASSDMTHYESADSAARKDRLALEAVERLDGRELLHRCATERISMCGRAPAATVLEAARQLGATRAQVVDYRHSGWVTGDDSSVVAYAGVVIH